MVSNECECMPFPGSIAHQLQVAGLLSGKCGDPAIGRFASMCVHEHRREAWLCEVHAHLAAHGLARCKACARSDDPHTCYLQSLTELERVP